MGCPPDLPQRRPARPAAPLLAAALAVATPACGIIGSTDDGGEAPPTEQAPSIREVSPAEGTISTAPTFRIRFDRYLDDDAFRSFDAGTLRTGARSWSGWTSWVMTDKTLVWEARSRVEPGLRVSLGLTDQLESVSGVPWQPANPVATYTVDADASSPSGSPYPPASSWKDVRAIFERHCNDCHGTSRWHDLTPLTREALVGRSSEQVDRPLVRPYDPADSYLMHKLLWDYPTRRLEPQPPPWADEIDGVAVAGEELARRELLAIEGWIASGAR